MVKVESKKIVAPPPIEIVMTMDILTARAVKAAIQVASRNDGPYQNVSTDALKRLVEVANKLYNANVVIQPEDVVNKKY